MKNSWIIKGGRIIDPSTGINEVADLFITNGIITDKPAPGASIYNAEKRTVTPGFIDLHVHFREPGNERAETVKTGSLAAACGGFTHVVTMPNTTPATDSIELVSRTLDLGNNYNLVKILPSASITIRREGKELTNFQDLISAGACAFTDDGSTVESTDLMLKAMENAYKLNAPIMDHALSPTLAGKGVMRACRKADDMGLPGIPVEAETEIVKRDIELSRQTGCHIHIQHISSGRTVDLIRSAKSKGICVSAEATPHHIALSIDDINPDDTSYKMNPPLGTREDCWNIINGIVDGAIEAFATDHAPHTTEDKSKGFVQAPFGIIGLETAIAVTFSELVRSGIMNITDWVARWTSGPAKIIRLKNHSIAYGNPADITILDETQIWTVEESSFRSKSRNSPFIGRTLACKPVSTFINGRLISI